MTANNMIQNTISRHIYPKLKMVIWGAYAYGVYYVTAGQHWGDVWYFMTDGADGNDISFLVVVAGWVSVIGGTISSLAMACMSVDDGEFKNQWDRMFDEIHEDKLSIFGGILLGILYLLLVPYLALAAIFYGFAAVLAKRCIPKG